MTKEQLIDHIKSLNSPIEGEVAFELWVLLNSDYVPYDTAYEIYEACGYVPFQGYPLRRKPKC
jgi:hypothetical protein